jgi:hypothetical protein
MSKNQGKYARFYIPKNKNHSAMLFLKTFYSIRATFGTNSIKCKLFVFKSLKMRFFASLHFGKLNRFFSGIIKYRFFLYFRLKF